jgi:hypothetical protein
MIFSLEIPEGFEFFGISQAGSKLKGGDTQWLAYLRKSDEIRGGWGFSPQEAIDQAQKNLTSTLEARRTAPRLALGGLRI